MTIEERVRETLRRQADGVRLSPDAWDRIEAAGRPASRTAWPLWALGAAAAAVLIVVGVVVARDADDTAEVATATSAEPAPSTTTTGGEPPSTVGAPSSTTTSTTAAPPTTTTTAPPTTTTTAAPPTFPVVTTADRLTLDGIGAIRIGMTLDELAEVSGSEVTVSRIHESSACGFVLTPQLPVGLMVHGQQIARIDVGGDFTTLSGIGVGSTEDEVMSTYPGRITVEPHPYAEEGHYLVYTPQDPAYDGYLMIFETDGSVVTGLRAGFEGPVRYIEGCA